MPRDEDDDDEDLLTWGKAQIEKHLRPLQSQRMQGSGQELPDMPVRTRFILEAMKAYIQRGGYNTEETALAAVRTADATLKAAAQTPE